jgi:hypothetical protein
MIKTIKEFTRSVVPHDTTKILTLETTYAWSKKRQNWLLISIKNSDGEEMLEGDFRSRIFRDHF